MMEDSERHEDEEQTKQTQAKRLGNIEHTARQEAAEGSRSSNWPTHVIRRGHDQFYCCG